MSKVILAYARQQNGRCYKVSLKIMKSIDDRSFSNCHFPIRSWFKNDRDTCSCCFNTRASQELEGLILNSPHGFRIVSGRASYGGPGDDKIGLSIPNSGDCNAVLKLCFKSEMIALKWINELGRLLVAFNRSREQHLTSLDRDDVLIKASSLDELETLTY